jgi:hypothetical protein
VTGGLCGYVPPDSVGDELRIIKTKTSSDDGVFRETKAWEIYNQQE